MEVQYLTDRKGKPKAVQITMKDWKTIKKELEKSTLTKSLKHAFKEIERIEKGAAEYKTLDQLLNEL